MNQRQAGIVRSICWGMSLFALIFNFQIFVNHQRNESLLRDGKLGPAEYVEIESQLHELESEFLDHMLSPRLLLELLRSGFFPISGKLSLNR
jgi:hypothetical protein